MYTLVGLNVILLSISSWYYFLRVDCLLYVYLVVIVLVELFLGFPSLSSVICLLHISTVKGTFCILEYLLTLFHLHDMLNIWQAR